MRCFLFSAKIIYSNSKNSKEKMNCKTGDMETTL